MYFSGSFTKCNYISSTKQTGCFLFFQQRRGVTEDLWLQKSSNDLLNVSKFVFWLLCVTWMKQCKTFKMLSLEAQTELHLFRIPFLESSNLQDPRVLKQHLWHRELSAVFWYLNFGWIWVYGVFSSILGFLLFPYLKHTDFLHFRPKQMRKQSFKSFKGESKQQHQPRLVSISNFFLFLLMTDIISKTWQRDVFKSVPRLLKCPRAT